MHKADLPQGDAEIVKIVEGMGVKVQRGTDSITIESDGGNLSGGTFDLGDTGARPLGYEVMMSRQAANDKSRCH